MDPAGEKGPVAAGTEQFVAGGMGATPGVAPGAEGRPVSADPEKAPIAPQPSTPSSENSIEKKETKIDMPGADEKQEDPLSHLPPEERAVIERQTSIPEVQLNFFSLYRFATPMDKLWLFVGVATSIISGAILPLMTILFGSLSQAFQDFALQKIDSGELGDEIDRFTLYFLYLGIGEFVMVYIATVTFIYTGEHVSQKIREQYLRAILRQNIGFFDKLGAGEVTTRITADTNLIQEGISEKVGLTLTGITTFITAFIIGFVRNWKLTFILSSTVVAITLIMGTGSRFMIAYNKKSIDCYGEGGTVAEEVISSIRNATAFSTQDKLATQYDTFLGVAQKWGTKAKQTMGIMVAGMMCVVFMTYGLAFWQGSKFLTRGDANLSQILTVMMAVMIGAFSLGGIAPHAQSFTTAVSAAAKIFATIDRPSPLDPDMEGGETLDHVEGHIELKNIKHIYPSRPTVTVLKNMNLVIPAGKVTALVGQSGSGKSTIVGLVERFYDPVHGQVFLDGHDVSKLNLRWLRQHVSLVQQEPVLFGTTIFQNVCHGLIGTKYENATEEEKRELVIKACEMSNADTFIRSLPEAYETNVGERGFLMSGGQKQRIAIARAIVSDPKILLLDEATSALDTRSEGVVQAALDAASMGRTTIVIAHRLSTIRNADNIVVMNHGEILEQGTHDDLLEKRGAYYDLVEAQRISAENERKEAIEGIESEADIDDDEKLKLKITKSHHSDKEIYPEEDRVKLTRTGTAMSESSKVLKNKKEEEAKKYSLWTLIKLIAGFNKTEKLVMFIGLVASVITGAGNPVQAILFSRSIVALSRPPSEYDQLKKDANFWSGMYLLVAGVMFIGYVIQNVTFAYCSERLIRRVRDRAFRTMLRQDIGFFDREENTTGALTSFLSTETTHVAGMSGVTLGTILSVCTTLLISIILGLASGWKLALVCTACVPLLLAAGFWRFWILAQFQQRAKAAYEKSGGYACEAASAIRTVASLTREKDVWENYHQQLDAQAKKSLASVLKTSILYGLSQCLMFLVMALGFWYGGHLIAKSEYSLQTFFVVFMAIVFGAQSAGTIFSFAPDMGKAKHAAKELKILFDRKPEIDTWSEEGEDVPEITGSIEFRDVHFRYPTRTEVPVLRGLDLTVRPGQYVALVGQSGCGKSTTIGLIERFYNPLVGGIFVDGREISTLNLNQYRSHIALVSQEPTLYQGTIRENILLGCADPNVSEADLHAACEAANIKDFILSLPEGFDTLCGSKGTLLSGGQKQRIAIARALIRNPKILLLDEATSALDSESEKVVQAALDKAAKGRTTIAVAHRLSTIQKADMICVFVGGKVVEKGTHQELMQKRGRYYELVELQSLEKRN